MRWRDVPGPWRRLRVGDWIRIVRMPSDASKPGCTFPPETRALYRRLIARRRPLRVFRKDDDGLPWVRCRFAVRGGREYHELAIMDDSWVAARPRKRAP
jgi:hypothetical protein